MAPQEDEEMQEPLEPLVMMLPQGVTRSHPVLHFALISNPMEAMEESARAEARVYAAGAVAKGTVRSLKISTVILLAQQVTLTHVVTLAMLLPATRSLHLRGLVKQDQVRAKQRGGHPHMIVGITLAYVTYVVSFLTSPI